MSMGLALFLIFCTPLGWIGMVIMALAVCLIVVEARS